METTPSLTDLPEEIVAHYNVSNGISGEKPKILKKIIEIFIQDEKHSSCDITGSKEVLPLVPDVLTSIAISPNVDDTLQGRKMLCYDRPACERGAT